MNNESSSNNQTPPKTPKTPSSSSSVNHYHPSPSRTIYSDRFIPSQSASNFALFAIPPPPPPTSTPPPTAAGTRQGYTSSPTFSAAYSSLLRKALFGSDLGFVPPNTPDKLDSPVNQNIFRFKSETKRSLNSLFPVEFDNDGGGSDQFSTRVSHRPAKSPRIIPKSPYKVLDAPALQDDYYLNLVDWSSNNFVSVGLGNCVYLLNVYTNKVTKLCDLGSDETVCSVGWSQPGTSLAVGSSNGEVQIWDAVSCKRVRTMEGHSQRIGALAWSSTLLSSGSLDKTVLHRDHRAREDFVRTLNGHNSEVCGLKWSYDNRELASGANDNKLFVWNQHSTKPVLKYSKHKAAVKAIAWSPHSYGLLASGGGTADRCIRFWNTTTNSHLSCLDTGSQVCNLVWSKNANELVSTHGYSQNQIIVWKYPTMSKLATLTGHTYRVLYLAISPDGQTIVTGAGDETLRFWNAFSSPKNIISEFGASSFGRTHIR